MLTAAALLCFGIGLVHSVLGERYILTRLFRRSRIPPLFGDETFTKRTLRFAWHLTTVAWWGFGSLLLVLSSEPAEVAPAVLKIVSIVFFISGAVTFVASRGRHLAWIVFLAIGVLCALSR